MVGYHMYLAILLADTPPPRQGSASTTRYSYLQLMLIPILGLRTVHLSTSTDPLF